MERFHVIEDAAAILRSRGVFRQAKVYRRGTALYAQWGVGFIRLHQNGTSLPNVTCEAIEIPDNGAALPDTLGRLNLKEK